MTDILLQVGVKILLKNSDGKFLLLRRSLEKYPEIKGRWDIVGGRIDPGIALKENLIREIDEETGLTLVGEPTLIAAQDILRSAGRHVVRLTFVGVARGDILLDTSENDMFQWHTATEIRNHPDLDMYVRELLDNGTLQLPEA